MVFHFTPTTVTIELQGLEQLWALRRRLVVERTQIEKVERVERFSDWRPTELRLPGTYMPAVLMAGSYWTPEGWDFIYSSRPSGLLNPKLSSVLVVTTASNRYRRIIVGASDQQMGVWLDWWRA